MVDYGDMLNKPPYSMNKEEKHKFLTSCLGNLTRHHQSLCAPYAKILKAMNFDASNIESYYDIPFLPVRLFKEYDLKSIENDGVAKTLTSSGTSGQQVSKIYLDKTNAANQTKALTKIISSFLGTKRLPMIVLDTSAVVKDRAMLSARGAGILGFSIFARDRIFALDENMELDLDGLNTFLEKHKGEKIFLFGFTFMIWQHFYEKLKKSEVKIDLSNGVLIHGGGWKKLAGRAVTPDEFKSQLYEVCGVGSVHDYYGMVEQTGTVYMECEYGHMHTGIFSDVIIRRPYDFTVAQEHEKGLIEVVSILPTSYPGHVLLTEDEGEILGEDDCPCGRLGKYFKIHGRIKDAEIRGCSDTYADKFK